MLAVPLPVSTQPCISISDRPFTVGRMQFRLLQLALGQLRGLLCRPW